MPLSACNGADSAVITGYVIAGAVPVLIVWIMSSIKSCAAVAAPTLPPVPGICGTVVCSVGDTVISLEIGAIISFKY